MSTVISVVVVSLLLVEFVSLTIEILGWRRQPAVVRRRRVLMHLGFWVLVIGGFWAIVHFGPLRPVHEWFR